MVPGAHTGIPTGAVSMNCGFFALNGNVPRLFSAIFISPARIVQYTARQAVAESCGMGAAWNGVTGGSGAGLKTGL